MLGYSRPRGAPSSAAEHIAVDAIIRRIRRLSPEGQTAIAEALTGQRRQTGRTLPAVSRSTVPRPRPMRQEAPEAAWTVQRRAAVVAPP